MHPARRPPAPISISAGITGGQPKNTSNDTMNKKTIVALLAKHGIQATETETEEQLQAKLDKIPLAAAAPAAATQPAASMPANITDLSDVRAELSRQKRQRIEDKIAGYVDTQQ